MKKIIHYIICLTSSAYLLAGCDKGFDELNINKVTPADINPAYVMNNAVIGVSYPLETIVFELPIVQQIVTPFGGVLGGGNFNQDNRPRNAGNWIRYYDVTKSLTDVLNRTKEDDKLTNLYNSARILRSFAAMILTDSYGDVPYSEAGLGYIGGIVLPKYDSQEDIYKDVLKELDEASAGLDTAKPLVTNDVLYGGNISNWKAFGYSLLLRAAMRLSKVDPALAQQYVSKAVAGGVMTSNAANAVIRHTSLFRNAIGEFLNGSEANNYYLTANFVQYLQDNNDPRLGSIAVRYAGAKSGTEQIAARASTNPADQKGMPMGYDNGSIGAVATANGLASFYDYSQLDRNRMGKNDAPVFLVTYAQTQLLLSEASVRGWITNDPAALYTAGIKAHMEQLALYVGAAIPPAGIEAYLTAHPLNVSNQLEEINTQYWVASFLNGPEAFANFRRSGFPALTPNPFPGKDITTDFIHRLTYPDTEIGINPENVKAAISRQGENKLDTRVWWDK